MIFGMIPEEPATVRAYLPPLLIAAGILLIILLPKLRRRRMQDLPTPKDHRIEADMQSRLEQLLIQIQELSREHIARLDSKIRMLNQLLIEADQKKKEIETLLARTVASSASPADISTRPTHPLHQKIYALRDQGRNLSEICSTTGLEPGEVELVLGLRQIDKS